MSEEEKEVVEEGTVGHSAKYTVSRMYPKGLVPGMEEDDEGDVVGLPDPLG